MSLASLAAQQTAAQRAAALTSAADNAASGVRAQRASAATATGATTAAARTASGNALSSLSGNFQDFLSMLMTQLKNQDPSSPMDANSFTSELVQFSSVEQQINTNQSLTQLIQLTQSGEILQSSSMLGHQVAVQSDHLPLQNGSAEVQFTTQAAGPVALAVYNDAGVKLTDATVNATQGTNTWMWNGATTSGATAPDGSYAVGVMGLDASGNATAVPFAVVGTATGVHTQNNALQLQLGPESVNFTAVKSVVK